MGATGSKEITLRNDARGADSSPAAVPAHPSPSAAGDSAASSSLTASLHEAEEALFNEGMKQGARDALSRLDAELDRQVQAAYLRSSLKDEDERRLALNAELDRLSRSYYRAPMRQPACQDAERAVLACDPRSDPNQCDDAVRAYVRCADALTFRLMNPGRE